jgi:hypothetical protein
MEFASILTTLFIGLKLTDYIDWSWLWVLAPLWIAPILAILLAFAGGLVKEIKRNRRMK